VAITFGTEEKRRAPLSTAAFGNSCRRHLNSWFTVYFANQTARCKLPSAL